MRRFLASVQGQAECVAVSGVFSPVLSDQETRVEELVREILGDIPVSLSHEIGSLGLLERENACVLNAALVGVAARVTAGLTDAMSANGITAEAYIAQNDGTLMSLDYVRRYPILTIGSGPTNSMRGASYLTGVADALVVDVGGTSTDIGILSSGFPRESSTAVEIGGVRTNFRMPDLVSDGPRWRHDGAASRRRGRARTRQRRVPAAGGSPGLRRKGGHAHRRHRRGRAGYGHRRRGPRRRV